MSCFLFLVCQSYELLFLVLITPRRANSVMLGRNIKYHLKKKIIVRYYNMVEFWFFDILTINFQLLVQSPTHLSYYRGKFIDSNANLSLEFNLYLVYLYVAHLLKIKNTGSCGIHMYLLTNSRFSFKSYRDTHIVQPCSKNIQCKQYWFISFFKI